MRSLFDDSCCGRVRPASTCKGCVCSVLNRLANSNNCDVLADTRTVVNLLPKGQAGYLFMDGAFDPTPFTFLGFEQNSCCARFSYEPADGATGTRMVIIDCNTLAGISRVPQVQ